MMLEIWPISRELTNCDLQKIQMQKTNVFDKKLQKVKKLSNICFRRRARIQF